MNADDYPTNNSRSGMTYVSLSALTFHCCVRNMPLLKLGGWAGGGAVVGGWWRGSVDVT